VDTLRKKGYAIYRNSKKAANGTKISFYRLGKPTRAMVAAGVLALRQHGINAFA
jgi:hypothetical protein